MTDFLIRDVDDEVMRRLKERAQRNGHSLQQEVHDALAKAARPTSDEIRRMFEEFDAKHGPINLDADEIVEIIRQERESR